MSNELSKTHSILHNIAVVINWTFVILCLIAGIVYFIIAVGDIFSLEIVEFIAHIMLSGIFLAGFNEYNPLDLD